MNSRRIVAIHQPNFFPWLGYFHKIAQADVFIIMDNVQFPKKGGTWSNRVKLIMNGQANWLTMPILRNYHGTLGYRDVLIDNRQPWRSKVLKTLQLSYSRAHFFDSVFPYFASLIENPTESLVEYNIAALTSLVQTFGWDPTKLVLGSSLGHFEEDATDLIIAMVKAVEGTAYLCGGGASGYQEDEKFSDIELIYQNFHHPQYPQANTSNFIPGLSIIDFCMNSGLDAINQLLASRMASPSNSSV